MKTIEPVTLLSALLALPIGACLGSDPGAGQQSSVAAPAPLTVSPDPELIPESQRCICPLFVNAVCGDDGRTYPNACLARCAGARVANPGFCEPKDAGADTGSCVDNIFCALGEHFDKSLCRCVSDADAGSGARACRTDLDCPPVGVACRLCPDGVSVCPGDRCVDGRCSVTLPVCSSVDTGAGPGEPCGLGSGDPAELASASQAKSPRCAPGLVCCSPCGRPGCRPACMPPCAGPGCYAGCRLLP